MHTVTPGGLTPEGYKAAIDHAIALELTTIPCYLSTYYSIVRTQDQDDLYKVIHKDIKNEKLAKEMTLDVLLFANKAGANIMSVAVEEMLHLSLASNIKQATVAPPDLMSIGKDLTYPATLFTPIKGNPEFKINRAPLSIDQLIILLKIESPNRFGDKAYQTIGEFYQQIQDYIDVLPEESWAARRGLPQLVPSQPYYAQNTINTVHYNADHKPQFPSQEQSGGIIEVVDQSTANYAMQEITEQGEGHSGGDTLEFRKDGRPKPLPVVDGKVVFKPEDYDAPGELSHFAKFMEIYSLALHYEEKFDDAGAKPFLSYFVKAQKTNPSVSDYSKNKDGLKEYNDLANAIYTYLLLMIQTCYYQQMPVQYEIFMMGIHKSMIWILGYIGGDISSFNIAGTQTPGSVTFEYFNFSSETSPKAQMINIANQLIAIEEKKIESGKASKPNRFAWLIGHKYLPSLPDISVDGHVQKMPFFTAKN